MHLDDQKLQLRESIRDRIARMTKEQMFAEGRSITRRILDALPQEPMRICAYYPLRDEANISPLLPELLKRGDTLYLPRFRNNSLTFAQVTDLKTLPPGGLNIPEAPMGAYEPKPEEIDIVLIPGRAFDRLGNRIGRGNGGYDIWIRKQRKLNPNTQYWGVAMECQLVNLVPNDENDERMDRVITGRGIVEAPQAKQA